jgi:hypothetical protein
LTRKKTHFVGKTRRKKGRKDLQRTQSDKHLLVSFNILFLFMKLDEEQMEFARCFIFFDQCLIASPRPKASI